MIFEYKTLTLPSSTERQAMLTEMGLGGWELVGFEQGLAYFKRPKPELPTIPLSQYDPFEGFAPRESITADLGGFPEKISENSAPFQSAKKLTKKK